MKNLSKLRGVIAVLVITVFFTPALASCDDEPETGGIISVKNTLSEDITVNIEQMEKRNNNNPSYPEYTANIIGKPYSDIPIVANSTKDFSVPDNGIYRVSYYVSSDTAQKIKEQKTALLDNHVISFDYSRKVIVIFFN